MMSELLARYTSLPVVKAENETPVEADHIYLIPPRKNMTIKNRKLFLTEQAIKHSPNLPIDIFFRSLAADIGNKAIGIVLSGTGSDGTWGQLSKYISRRVDTPKSIFQQQFPFWLSRKAAPLSADYFLLSADFLPKSKLCKSIAGYTW